MINSINSNSQELLKQAQNGDNNAINQLCQGIYNATANKLGTDENYVNTIMQNADSKTLASIMDSYSDVTGSEIFKDIENDFSGKAEKEILATLENAYKEANNEEYTGDNDGKLSIDQKVQSIGKGLLNKTPDIALTIGGVVLAKSAIGACISGVATTALTAVFGTAAATIATIAAPVLAGVGLVAAGVMIYKGVTQTAKAIKDGQNATTDDIAQNALQDGTEGVVTTGLGIYEGYESIKAFSDIAKANNANKQYQQEINAEAQTRIEQEQLATQRAQQAQTEYNKPFEDALSHKSAQESAEVFNEIYDEVDLRIAEQQQIARAQQVQDELIDAMQHPSRKSAQESAEIFGIADTSASAKTSRYCLSKETIEQGTSYLAAPDTPEYEALAKIIEDEFIVIPDKDSALNVFRQEYASLNLQARDDIIVLNPNDLKKATTKKIGTSNAYMSEWYMEANGLNGTVYTRETLQNAIDSSNSDVITIIIPDDFAGSGRSMFYETARTLNGVELPDGKSVNLIFSPMVSTPNAQAAFKATSLMDLDALQATGSLNSGDDVVMREFFDKFNGKINISTVKQGSITATPYYQTEYFMKLSSENPELAQTIDALLTCNGSGKGYGRTGASGVLVATPTIDGSTLKCPNNNPFGATPYALLQGATPDTIKLPGKIVIDGQKLNTGRWHHYLKDMLVRLKQAV